MIKIEVGPDASVRTVAGVSAKNNKPYSFRVLGPVYAHTLADNGQPHRHPSKTELRLEADEAAPAVGTYLLAPASIYVDRGGRLALAPRLVPAAAPAAAR